MPVQPGFGLLSGLAEGVKQGLITYQTQQNINQQRQMTGAMHGLVQDPNGNWTPSPLLQKKQAAEGLLADKTMREEDPSNPYAASVIENYNRKGVSVPEGSSAKDAKDYGQKILEARARGDMTGDRMERQRRSREMSQANRSWDAQFGVNSPVSMRLDGVVRMNNLIAAAERGEIATTEQFLNRANAEVTALETGRNSFPLGSQERTELESGAAELRSLVNKWAGEQKGTDLRPHLAELKANMADMSGSYMDQAERRAQQMESGATDYGYDVVRQKHDTLKKQYGKALGHWGHQPTGLVSPGAIPEQMQPLQGGPHPHDNEAVAWAKKNPKDPRSAQILKANGFK